MSRLASVRVRVTALATLIVAVTLTLAAVGLVASVHHQLVDKLRQDSEARVSSIATQLREGVPPDKVLTQAAGDTTGLGPVTIYNENGVVLAGTPRVGGQVTGPGNTIVSVTGTGSGTGPTAIEVQQAGVSTSQGQLTVVAASSLTGVEHDIDTLKGTLELGVPLVVILVGLAAWVMVGRALHPVEAIRAEVEAISGSTMHRRVPERATGDEVDRLAHTMNAMLDRLESASTKQRQFVADASHELRSPIAAMRAQLEVARGDRDADWDRVTDDVLAEEARLERIVDDLLLLASADEQTATHSSPTIDLVTVVREEVARARRLPVQAALPSDPVLVDVEPRHLATAITNLLDNATRHARSRVEVSVAVEGDRVRLSVDDDGPGIPPPDRERVFERFTRLDAARARRDGGAGLGLAVTKALVERAGGTVGVDDAPIGGARLVLTLPPRMRADAPGRRSG